MKALIAVVSMLALAACAPRAPAPPEVPRDRVRLTSTRPVPETFERILARTRSLAYVVEEIDTRRGYLRVVAHHRDTEGFRYTPWRYIGPAAPRRPGYLHVQIYRDGTVSVLAVCAHVEAGKAMPEEFYEEMLTYARALREALAAASGGAPTAAR